MYIAILLVKTSLYFYIITLQREFSNSKTQLCQVRTQWCQKNHCARTYFWLVCACAPHLLFIQLPHWYFSFTYQPFKGPVVYVVENFQCLIFFNCQSPDKITVNLKRTAITKNPLITCSSPRRAVRSHSLVCNKNSLLIIGIWPIRDKEL